ncbi:hemin-degrading factor [Rhodophyticola sp. CCM32]|uniref:hemin-degrading factor n=1 Tax=Rhodophyticola sp. CCM32 TaxID=2916397 RepID=UPI00107F3BE4|nr:ChuX/HutX family heme-like substrate-binding protein [Rhodophyticola sp. CCM32]QBY01481.1 hemin-degrading factor [Rhodophyticola sp. CCM32]
MAAENIPSEDDIRAAIAANPKARPRDLADQLGIAEAALVAADLSNPATRIEAAPERLMPMICGLGEVMALTRNESAVHEKIGVYDNFHPGAHAAMILTAEIDLRIFPNHWQHAFAVEKEVGGQLRRSLQVFDAAGDAVHKVILRDGSDMDGWARLTGDLACADPQPLDLAVRAAPEQPKADPDKAEALRREWARMTDTHQFMRLVSKLKMNRLGAYRIAGGSMARLLQPAALNTALETLSQTGTGVMIFVGNKGCIQIHSGPVDRLKPMGPWQNVMDPGFNLHLRRDHVAEVWLVEKPTKRGPALSIEAFDDMGRLILQMFGLRKEKGPDHAAAFARMAEDLPRAETLAGVAS